MISRLGTAIASISVAAAVAVAFATSGQSGTTAPSKWPPGVVEDCSTTPGWGRSDEFTRRKNLVLGPLAIKRGAVVWEYQDPHGRGAGDKLFVFVRGGHRVTLELSPRTREGAGLGFAPPPQGIEWNLRNARRVVTFIACRRGERSGRFDGWPVTSWVGALLVRSPQCVPLRVWVDDEPRPHRAVIRFGVRSCG